MTRRPVAGRYRDLDVRVVPPNSQGFVLLEILEAVERLGIDPDPLGPDAGAIALVVRAAREDRDRHLADPAAMRVHPGTLLDDGHIAALTDAVREAHAPAVPARHGSHHGDTVGLVTADAEGNAVSLIQSLYDGLGSGILEPSTGIVAQSRGAQFVLDPDHPNVLAPGKRPAHTLMPALGTAANGRRSSWARWAATGNPRSTPRTWCGSPTWGWRRTRPWPRRAGSWAAWTRATSRFWPRTGVPEAVREASGSRRVRPGDRAWALRRLGHAHAYPRACGRHARGGLGSPRGRGRWRSVIPWPVHTSSSPMSPSTPMSVPGCGPRRVRSLIADLDAIVWEADARSCEWPFVSDGATEILGYAPREWLAEPSFWADRLHPEDRERAVAAFIAAATQGVRFDIEYRIRSGDRSTVWLRDLGHVVRDGDGRPHRVRGLMVEITETKHLDEQRREGRGSAGWSSACRRSSTSRPCRVPSTNPGACCT